MMKPLIQILLAASALLGANAFAEYKRLAECTGFSDSRLSARALLFVNKAADTQGMVQVSFNDGSDFLSNTTVAWNSNPQGFPRFFNNDFDLDIVINDHTKSMDDVLVGGHYIGSLECVYTP